MIIDVPIFEQKINLGFALLMVLIIVTVVLLIKLARKSLRIYSKKYILKIIFFLFLTFLSFSLIISSIIFFYKTTMLRMLIPSVMGIVLLIIDAIIYVLFFDNTRGY